MEQENYKNNCMGCIISQGNNETVNNRGGIIELEGNWIINHYGGEEGFLGWLTLQPKYHITYLTDIREPQANSLIPNIQNIDIVLRQYWMQNFKDDPLKLLYTAYFFESILERAPGTCHLHMHLIPRPKSLSKLKIFSDVICNTKIGTNIIEKAATETTGWRIHLASKHPDFPPEYKVPNDIEGNCKAAKLMEFLFIELSKITKVRRN